MSDMSQSAGLLFQSYKEATMEDIEVVTPGSFPPLEIEKYMLSKSDVEWNKNLWPYTIYWSAVYLLLIFSLKSYMKLRPAYNLRYPLIIWNCLLAIFSICGTLRMLPGLWILNRDFGFTFSVCNISFAKNHHPLPLWILLFTWSKLVEFGDSVFIVLRKNNLIFLHWYHHIATLIFTWYNASNESSTGYWFCTMNFFVHSFMYTYFAFKAMGLKIPRSIAMCITTLQIMQMFMGCFVTFWALINYASGEYCEQNIKSISFAVVLYLSYVFLFCRLFYKLYILKQHKTAYIRKTN